MLDILTFLAIPLTALFQYKVGGMALAKNKKAIFFIICLSSLILNVFLTYRCFLATITDLLEKGNHCVMGAVMIPIMGLIYTVVLLVIMLMQWINRKSYSN